MLNKYSLSREDIDTLVGIEELNNLSIGEFYVREEDEDGEFTVVTGWGTFYYAIVPILEKRYLNTEVEVYFNGYKVDITLEEMDQPLVFKERVDSSEANLVTVIGRGRVVEFIM